VNFPQPARSGSDRRASVLAGTIPQQSTPAAPRHAQKASGGGHFRGIMVRRSPANLAAAAPCPERRPADPAGGDFGSEGLQQKTTDYIVFLL
jgi:hypothetical protein